MFSPIYERTRDTIHDRFYKKLYAAGSSGDVRAVFNQVISDSGNFIERRAALIYVEEQQYHPRYNSKMNHARWVETIVRRLEQDIAGARK